MRLLLCCIGLSWALAGFAQGQNLSYYLPEGDYDPSVPTPEAWLGFPVGAWHVNHDQLSGYMRALDAASERVNIEPMGQTHEGRSTFVLRITSPANQANITQLRAQHLKLSDPDISATVDVSRMPAVVWMGYSIHGNEASGSNAALLVAYYLAAARNENLDRWLENCIVLLDPCFNPDGLTRFAAWVNARRSLTQVSDPAAMEFHEPWPGGRTNHYGFDLNRDWLMAQQPESQARLAKYHEWMPNLLTDHHEMGKEATFFFQPGVSSRVHPLIPEETRTLTGKLARFHAAALDRIGSLYYNEEGYDDFYFGKGSTYPDLNGGVGILFEQASARGHAQETRRGVLTFPFAIRNQVTASLSSLEGIYTHREEFLRWQRDFFREALRDAEDLPLKAWVAGATQDPLRLQRFAEMLLRHGIEVYRPARAITVAGVHYEPGNSLLIPVRQAHSRLVQALFQRETRFQDSIFYDISAWTAPLAYGLPHAALDAGNFSPQLLGEQLEKAPVVQGGVKGERSAYAYVISWQAYHAPRMVHELLDAGISLACATRPFQDNHNRRFDYGSIVLPVAGQPLDAAALYERLNALAQRDGIEVYHMQSGYTANGIDLGSEYMQPLKLPKALLLAGEGVSAYDAGELWHLMDQRYRIPLSVVAQPQFARADLSRYTHILMVDGNYDRLDEGFVEKLRQWLNNGGVIVAQGRAGQWLAQKNLSNLKFRQAAPIDQDTQRFSFEQREQRAGAQQVAGAIMAAAIDRSHPLCFGLEGDEIASFRNNRVWIEPAGKGQLDPIRYTANPLLSGYLSRQNLTLSKDAAIAAVSRAGNGRIISLTDNPNFRAFWYGTSKVIANALFFAGFM